MEAILREARTSLRGLPAVSGRFLAGAILMGLLASGGGTSRGRSVLPEKDDGAGQRRLELWG